MGEARQITDTILMVRPAHFGFNEQTAANNAFQINDRSLSEADIQKKARKEFDAFVAKLRENGIKVIVIDDSAEPVKPDAVFPNNWVTFHQDGTIVTYPMYSSIRRHERREDILKKLEVQFGFSKRLHFEQYENEGRYLEGTGSMIIDRPNRIVYACLSERTDRQLLEEFCRQRGYLPLAFTAVDSQGKEIYHTNVMMALGETFVVICLETVKDPSQRQMLLDQFARNGKEVIELGMDQMMDFAGNMLQVGNSSGQSFLVMSEKAFQSLTAAQRRQLEKHTTLLHSPINTIETYGGGSARCMMAELFVPTA